MKLYPTLIAVNAITVALGAYTYNSVSLIFASIALVLCAIGTYVKEN